LPVASTAPAQQGLFHLELEIERLQNTHRFGSNFGTDAVTRQDTNLHGFPQSGEQPRLFDTALGLEFLDLFGVTQVRPISSQPFSRHSLRKASIWNGMAWPSDG
jgi:hypothetical protein